MNVVDTNFKKDYISLNIIKNLLSVILKILPTKIAYAHCDVPCGIYDPKSAQIAAAGVLKMVEKIINPPSRDEENVGSVINFHNAMTRYVLVKEDQARICKTELLILWTDFFKEEHLETYPNLHDIFWKAAKLCSINKQEVSIEHAQELVKVVDEIANMFQKAKNAAAKK